MFKGYGEDHGIEKNDVKVVVRNTDKNGVTLVELKFGKNIRKMRSVCISECGKRRSFTHSWTNGKKEIVVKGSRFLLMDEYLKSSALHPSFLEELWSRDGNSCSYVEVDDQDADDRLQAILKYFREIRDYAASQDEKFNLPIRVIHNDKTAGVGPNITRVEVYLS